MCNLALRARHSLIILAVLGKISGLYKTILIIIRNSIQYFEMFEECSRGTIEVIVGPMFAGKSAELLRKISILRYANRRPLIVKHSTDTRFSELEIVSRAGTKHISIPVTTVEEIVDLYQAGDYDALVIDEVQFFDPSLVDYLIVLANNGATIIAAGLDNSHLCEP